MESRTASQMEHKKEKAIEIKAKRSRLVILGWLPELRLLENTKVTDGGIRNVWWPGKGLGARPQVQGLGVRN
jgi:hypothetical protein